MIMQACPRKRPRENIGCELRIYPPGYGAALARVMKLPLRHEIPRQTLSRVELAHIVV